MRGGDYPMGLSEVGTWSNKKGEEDEELSMVLRWEDRVERATKREYGAAQRASSWSKG